MRVRLERVLTRRGRCGEMGLQGPPGTGKTTSILCLARALLGSAMGEAVLELNASGMYCAASCRVCAVRLSHTCVHSRFLLAHERRLLARTDDRGIDVVRNKIKMFASKKVSLPPGRHKIIILDEADRCGLSATRAGVNEPH
ncbi:AAA family ATPase [archaeon]|nr:MAG: AAA family ATPase [archaeon]